MNILRRDFIEKVLVFTFLFSFPFQIRHIISDTVPFLEYSSIFLYGTDILFVLILGLWFYRFDVTKLYKKKNFLIFLAGLLGVSFLTLFYAPSFFVAVFRFLKLIEFALIFLYFFFNYEYVGETILFLPLTIGGLLQSIIGIGQFIKQSSLGLYFLREPPIMIDKVGVAQFELAPSVPILRAYGTLPHPNVLAAVLLLALFSVIALYLKEDLGFKVRIFSVISMPILVLGLILTFSRAILGLGSIGLVVYLLLINRKRSLKTLFILVLSSIVFSFFLFPEIYSRLTTLGKGIASRASSSEIGILFFYNNFIQGVGIGSFVPYLQAKNFGFLFPNVGAQPVHNLPLLVAAELGIVGFMAFVGFLGSVLKNSFSTKGVLFGVLLLVFIGASYFDHFFWTIHQGAISFWLASAFALKYRS